MLKILATLFLFCSAAAADTYRFAEADGHLETTGEGCTGAVMKEITRAIADSVSDGLAVEITDKAFEIVKSIAGGGEHRYRAPRRATTSGGVVGIWTSGAKTGPGDILTIVTIGDVIPCDPMEQPHGCKSVAIALGTLGARAHATIGASVSLAYGKCSAVWTNAHGARGTP